MNCSGISVRSSPWLSCFCLLYHHNNFEVNFISPPPPNFVNKKKTQFSRHFLLRRFCFSAFIHFERCLSISAVSADCFIFVFINRIRRFSSFFDRSIGLFCCFRNFAQQKKAKPRLTQVKPRFGFLKFINYRWNSTTWPSSTERKHSSITRMTFIISAWVTSCGSTPSIALQKLR